MPNRRLQRLYGCAWLGLPAELEFDAQVIAVMAARIPQRLADRVVQIVPGADDVQIEILYCGVCHSDLHTVRNEWNNTLYPSVPGHEIVGPVTAMGANVSKFKVGDLAGVDYMVDSCQQCESCAEGEEQYCENGFTGTYNGPAFGGENTFGGYSDNIMTLVGAPDSPHPSPTVFNLIFKRRSLAGSLIGGIQETQDMLDFCAKHGILSDIEMIDIQNINEAYERMLKGDVKYRFVIDIDSLKKEKHAA